MEKQAGWRWCSKCQGLFSADNPTQGLCPADGKPHDGSTSVHYSTIVGEGDGAHQGGWRWCGKCQGLFYSAVPVQGVCPADHQLHDGSGSLHYAALTGEEGPGQQGGWRWCQNCQGMFYAGSQNQGACPASAHQQPGWRWCSKCQGMFSASDPSHGVCPADNKPHNGGTSVHYAAVVGDASPGQQQGWRWCRKCQGMFYAEGTTQGVCPADEGPHDGSTSLHYAFVSGSGAQGQQAGWRWCRRCQGMFYAGGPTQGVCPDREGGFIGEAHSHDGSTSMHYVAIIGDAQEVHDGSHSAHYAMVLDLALPQQLDFDASGIAFGGGTPVGGSAHVTLFGDGGYKFSGHFHDSGGTEYNTSLVCAIKDSANQVYTFQHAGHVAGTFEAGSRDDDWNNDGQNEAVARHWPDLAAGATAKFDSGANLDMVNLTNGIIGAFGLVSGVVQIVQAAED